MGARRGAAEGPTAPVSSIAHNPRNRRKEDAYENHKVESLAASMTEVGVLQPLAVCRYEVFLTHYPQYEEAVGQRDWVVLLGNRRLAAATLAGITEVPVHIVDKLGREDRFDDAVLIENIHRERLPPLEEAEAIEELVEKYGTQAAVAKRLGLSQPQVSQRLKLLKLAPALKVGLDQGDLTVEDARNLARLKVGEQEKAWARLKQRRAAESEDGDYAVISPGQKPKKPPKSSTKPDTATSDQATTAPPVEPETQPQGGPFRGVPLEEIAEQLVSHLDPPDLNKLIELLMEHAGH
jgi:ParB family chromosome partitioning protein